MTELHRARISIGLATDIPRAINVGALGGLAQTVAAAVGSPLRPEEILRMCTRDAAATDVGILEAGMRADIVCARQAPRRGFIYMTCTKRRF